MIAPRLQLFGRQWYRKLHQSARVCDPKTPNFTWRNGSRRKHNAPTIRRLVPSPPKPDGRGCSDNSEESARPASLNETQESKGHGGTSGSASSKSFGGWKMSRSDRQLRDMADDEAQGRNGEAQSGAYLWQRAGAGGADAPRASKGAAEPPPTPRSPFSALFPGVVAADEQAKIRRREERDEDMVAIPRPVGPTAEELAQLPEGDPGDQPPPTNFFKRVPPDGPFLLRLSYASKALTDADFRQLLPRGQHIPDWIPQDSLERVLPFRDPHSLERTGEYLLVFHERAAASSYIERARRVWRHAAAHTPSGVLSPLPPPRGMLAAGEDLADLVASFTLCPPQQEPWLVPLLPPYDPPVVALLAAEGGAPRLPPPADPRHARVLLLADGPSLSREELVGAVRADREARGVVHRLASPGGVQKLSTMLGVDARAAATGRIGSAFAKTYNRWVLTFEDRDAASAFVFGWTGRCVELRHEGGRGKEDVSKEEVTFWADCLW